MKINVGKIFKILSFISGLLMVFSYYLLSIEVSRIFALLFTIFIAIYLLIKSFTLVKGVREHDFDYFKNVIIGIVGGFTVFFLTKIDLNSSAPEGKDIWLFILSNLQLITMALFVIFLGYIISRKKILPKQNP